MKKILTKFAYVALLLGAGFGLVGCFEEKTAEAESSTESSTESAGAALADASDVEADSVIVAVVNGVKIPESRIALYAQGQPVNEGNRKLIIENMVSSELIAQAARDAGIADRADVRGQLIIAEQTVLGRAYGLQYLGANTITEEQINARFQEVLKEVAEQKEYDVAHILVADEAKANELHAKIKEDASLFGALAAEHSSDPGSAENDGKLGWVSPRSLVPEFGDAMEALAAGEMSAPVQSNYGWHIIRVDEVRESNAPAPELNDETRAQLEQVERATIFSKHIDSLREKAEVEIL